MLELDLKFDFFYMKTEDLRQTLRLPVSPMAQALT